MILIYNYTRSIVTRKKNRVMYHNRYKILSCISVCPEDDKIYIFSNVSAITFIHNLK